MRPCISLCRGAAVFAVFFILPLRRFWGNTCNRLRLRHDIMYFLQIENQNLSITELKLRLSLCRICLSSPKMQNPLQMWTTHCLKPMGFLLHRPRNLLSPQALIWAVPALYISLCYLSQSFCQYIFCGIDIPVMFCSAFRTYPCPHWQIFCIWILIPANRT